MWRRLGGSVEVLRACYTSETWRVLCRQAEVLPVEQKVRDAGVADGVRPEGREIAHSGDRNVAFSGAAG